VIAAERSFNGRPTRRLLDLGDLDLPLAVDVEAADVAVADQACLGNPALGGDAGALDLPGEISASSKAWRCDLGACSGLPLDAALVDDAVARSRARPPGGDDLAGGGRSARDSTALAASAISRSRSAIQRPPADLEVPARAAARCGHARRRAGGRSARARSPRGSAAR
jgi:hypothetical protein